MSRSNLHFLYNYNLVIYNDCGHFNVTLWARNTNTNTFYTFRCPQSLEMIRLYLYKKCKLERDMTLCGDNWLYKKLLWKNQGRPCWIQRENNDVNVYATSKSSLSVKKDIFLAYKGIISAGVCNFLSSLAMFTTTYKHKNLHWTLPFLTVDDRKR
jgi:hypothetical protein